jgi:hypothetical protein
LGFETEVEVELAHPLAIGQTKMSRELGIWKEEKEGRKDLKRGDYDHPMDGTKIKLHS